MRDDRHDPRGHPPRDIRLVSTGRRRTFARMPVEVAPHPAHVCQQWRHVVTVSPRRLDLRILCKTGAGDATTIDSESILDAWPTLPIVVRYKGCRNSKPKSGHGPLQGNVGSQRRRYGARVCEIDIGVTGLTRGNGRCDTRRLKSVSFSLPGVVLHTLLILVLLVKA